MGRSELGLHQSQEPKGALRSCERVAPGHPGTQRIHEMGLFQYVRVPVHRPLIRIGLVTALPLRRKRAVEAPPPAEPGHKEHELCAHGAEAAALGEVAHEV